MNKNGAIVIIEDDIDDQDIFKEVLKDLNFNNELIFFSDGQQGLKYLTESEKEPFIVFSDINMPKLSGMELRQKIHENENIRVKTIPYLFFTTSAQQENVIEAYSKSIQGFFIKPSNYNELKALMKKIIEYWKECVSPDFVK